MNILHNEPALHIFGAIFIIQLLLEPIERFPLSCKDVWSRSEFALVCLTTNKEKTTHTKKAA